MKAYLHVEGTCLAVPETVVETLCVIDLLLPLLLTHQTTSDSHISLVIPDTAIILLGLPFLLVLIQQ
jgi:hypothetical protein